MSNRLPRDLKMRVRYMINLPREEGVIASASFWRALLTKRNLEAEFLFYPSLRLKLSVGLLSTRAIRQVWSAFHPLIAVVSEHLHILLGKRSLVR